MRGDHGGGGCGRGGNRGSSSSSWGRSWNRGDCSSCNSRRGRRGRGPNGRQWNVGRQLCDFGHPAVGLFAQHVESATHTRHREGTQLGDGGPGQGTDGSGRRRRCRCRCRLGAGGRRPRRGAGGTAAAMQRGRGHEWNGREDGRGQRGGRQSSPTVSHHTDAPHTHTHTHQTWLTGNATRRPWGAVLAHAHAHVPGQQAPAFDVTGSRGALDAFGGHGTLVQGVHVGRHRRRRPQREGGRWFCACRVVRLGQAMAAAWARFAGPWPSCTGGGCGRDIFAFLFITRVCVFSGQKRA